MLSPEEIKEIREHLENAQNPLFFFDNDVDGLCSFLILQRALQRGKGVAIKSFPSLDKNYLRKIEELNPDAVFILDKPLVSKEFIEGVKEKNLPLIWIDHHEVQVPKEFLKEHIKYYNSFPTSEPVTFLAYNIFHRKEDIWLAMLGCIADVYLPEFAKEFSKEFPEIFPENTKVFDALFTTELGKVIKLLNFGLKDTTTNVLHMIRYLLKAKNVHDLLEENEYTKNLHKRYNALNAHYKKVLERADSFYSENEKLLFFSYIGSFSLSSELSNELYFRHPDNFIVVAYKKQNKANVSIRAKNAKIITLKAIKDIEGATGGGHEQACGANIPLEKIDEFKNKIAELLKP